MTDARSHSVLSVFLFLTGNFSQSPDFGFCVSQKMYYFGYKLHALCGLSGVIHSYDLSKASVADLHYMKDVKHPYHDCSIYGDKGYIGADVQLDLFETAHIRLECPYRLNQKDWKPTFIPFAKARKRIETIFSQLTDQFPDHQELRENNEWFVCQNQDKHNNEGFMFFSPSFFFFFFFFLSISRCSKLIASMNLIKIELLSHRGL